VVVPWTRGVDAEGACHLTVVCRFPYFAGLNEARPLWYTRQHGSAPGLGHQRILGGWAVKGRTASRLEHSGDSKLSLRRRRTTHELLELTWVRVMCLDVLLGADAGLLAARAQAAAQQPWKTGSLLQPIVSLLQPPIILLASAAPRHIRAALATYHLLPCSSRVLCRVRVFRLNERPPRLISVVTVVLGLNLLLSSQ
jgi:hypothetical protein